MATIGLDSFEVRNRARPSISLHPVFPAVVAMWFAALLGAGSLILPGVLLERAVEATGLAALVPAAASPLSLAARGLIALALSIAGALAGAAMARRLARAHGAGSWTEPAGFASGPRRPISVNEEIGGFGLPVAGDRMPASVEDDRPDDGPSMAPLPAGDDAEGLALDEQIVFGRPRAPHVSPPAGGEDEPAPLRFSPPSLARRARAEAGGEPQTAAPASASGLVALVERLRASIEWRRETLDHARPDLSPRNAPDNTDAALREALATLQRLRWAA